MPTGLPESLARGLRDIATLPQSSFEQFIAFLRAIPAEIKQHRVFSGSERKIPGIGEGEESIKGAAFSLLLSRASGHTPVDQFVTELIETLSSSPGFEEEETRRLLSGRAAEILSIQSLDLVSRAHDVLTEHACVYSTSRILSDIRPVFGNDVTVQPLGAVLVHMLSMVYVNAGRRENVVIALDEKDVDELLSVLDRAKKKAKTLKETLLKTDVPYIEVI